MQAPLYFIAVLPNDEISTEVTDFKNYADTNFDSRHALRSPPHITVIPPFRAYYNEIEKISNTLADFSKNQANFNIDLSNFNKFGQSVIYIDVAENADLQALWKALSLLMETDFKIVNKFSGRPFVPHMTVAFRDLDPKIFPNAWNHFSNIDYERTFETHDLVLLINEDKKWQIVQRFPFQSEV